MLSRITKILLDKLQLSLKLISVSLFFISTFVYTQLFFLNDEDSFVRTFLQQTHKQDRFFSTVKYIDTLVDGGEAYKNYLRASIFNETANSNVGDDYFVEYIALLVRNRANVGIAQVGPSGSEKGFVDRWLSIYGYTYTDLLNNDELNVRVKDAYVVDRQILEIPHTYAYVKNNFGLSCALNPRHCDELWTDKDALRVITQDSGHNDSQKIEDHHTRIYSLTCNQAGSRRSDFINHDVLKYNIIGGRNICNTPIITDTNIQNEFTDKSNIS